MANENNLKPVRSKSEARERGKNGGEKSGEARRKKRLLKDILATALSGTTEVDGKRITLDEAIVLSLIQKAQKGDVSAFLAIRDTLGEKASQKVDVQINDATREAYERAAAAIKGEG